MTTLEERLRMRLKDWGRLARRFRIAQAQCDERSDEWYLNKENAEMIERLSLELAGDLSVHELMANPKLPAERRPSARPNDPVNNEAV